jgi:uncharacterized membrane protein (DUF373 family)
MSGGGETAEHDEAGGAAADGAVGRAFLGVEHAVYVALGVLLAAASIAALVEAGASLWDAIVRFGDPAGILAVIDRLLFVLMLAEILHTVRVSVRSGELQAEPFLIVGLIASIRRVLVITLRSSEATHDTHWTPDVVMLFRTSMIELGVLGVLILVMVVSILMLRRRRILRR